MLTLNCPTSTNIYFIKHGLLKNMNTAFLIPEIAFFIRGLLQKQNQKSYSHTGTPMNEKPNSTEYGYIGNITIATCFNTYQYGRNFTEDQM